MRSNALQRIRGSLSCFVCACSYARPTPMRMPSCIVLVCVLMCLSRAYAHYYCLCLTHLPRHGNLPPRLTFQQPPPMRAQRAALKAACSSFQRRCLS